MYTFVKNWASLSIAKTLFSLLILSGRFVHHTLSWSAYYDDWTLWMGNYRHCMLFDNKTTFLCPRNIIHGHLVFVLSVFQNFCTVRDRDLIFGMHTQLMQPFQMTTGSMTLTSTNISKNLNFFNNFWTNRLRAFIFHMCMPCYKTFPLIPQFSTVWHWPLIYMPENFNLGYYY